MTSILKLINSSISTFLVVSKRILKQTPFPKVLFPVSIPQDVTANNNNKKTHVV